MLLIFILLVCTSCGGRAGSELKRGRWISGPNVGRLDLLAVDFVDSQTGLAVGDIDPGGTGGFIYRTVDGGNNWRSISRMNEILTSVHFVSPNIGWVVGHAGRIERTDDGGVTWRAQRIEREGEVLNSVFFVDERRGWVVGGAGLIFRTTNGGENWDRIATDRVEDLWSVRFASTGPLTGHGWIVGEDGLILSSADEGKTWTVESSGTSRALLAVAVERSMTVIAVGEAGTVLRNDHISNWSGIQTATTEALNCVASSGGIICAVGSKGTALESMDDGRTWSAITSVSSRDLNSIHFVDAARAVAVGQRGVTQVLQQY